MMVLKELWDVTKKRQARKTLYALPHFLTLLNACSGFLAITYALQDQLIVAALFIFCAAFFDACDGRLARALGSTSFFGAELDSLSDAVSFCCAPALLVYALYQEYVGICIIGSLLLFLCAGLFRLARFNIQKSDDRDCFYGLPTPMAALSMACVVLCAETSLEPNLLNDKKSLILSMLIIVLALLMVSRIPFQAFKKSNSMWYYAPVLGCMISLIGIGWRYGVPMLVAVPLGYIGGTIVWWAIKYGYRLVCIK